MLPFAHRPLLAGVAALGSLALLAPAAHAATSPTAQAAAQAKAAAKQPQAVFALGPATSATKGWFILSPTPGGEATGAVRVTNTGKKAGTVRLDAVDATTGATSGAVYRDRAFRDAGVGSWTRLERHRVKLAPGESAIVGFTVRVPASVTPGQHLGGIVAEQSGGAPAAKAKGSFRIKVRRQTILALQIDLPGARSAPIVATGVRSGEQSDYPNVLLGLSSPGTKLLKGRGRMSIATAKGDPVERTSFALDTFVPGTRVAFPVSLRKRLAPGSYTAVVTIRSARTVKTYRFGFKVADPAAAGQHYGPRAAAAAISDASKSPLALVGIAVLLIALSFGAGLVLSRRRDRRRDALRAAQAAAATAALLADARARAASAERELQRAASAPPAGDPDFTAVIDSRPDHVIAAVAASVAAKAGVPGGS